MSARDWLTPGLGVVSDRVSRAVRSYARDQLKRGQGLAVSWAMAAGLFVVAALFSVGLVTVGFIAFFNLLRLHFGLFESLGIVAGFLLVFALLLCGAAVWLTRRPTRQVPSLTSRLRVAAHAPLPARAGGDSGNATIQLSGRSVLLFAAAAIVLATAALGRR